MVLVGPVRDCPSTKKNPSTALAACGPMEYDTIAADAIVAPATPRAEESAEAVSLRWWLYVVHIHYTTEVTSQKTGGNLQGD